MLAAFDSNILIYAHLEPDTAKGASANALLKSAGASAAVVAAQVLGEFLWVVRRRRPDLLDLALEAVELLPPTIAVPHTDRHLMAEAARLAERHRLQFWDALILLASARAGATHLLSEDLQDGTVIANVRVVNPFAAANRQLLDRLLPPFP
ncbi:MAG: PIN domain-containing protein [Geminicoccaceae bacterium]